MKDLSFPDAESVTRAIAVVTMGFMNGKVGPHQAIGH
jgi:hypothetical protein